ncbi:type II secretion system protein J [Pelosinus sp. sgz500959]|uniref:type II secretion system protein J n=1 Tax=Pelosinus sp. sgz500959 TaxID=3242472 RepID=UPI00366FE0FA
MTTLLSNRKGFTLVELVIGIAIMTITLAGLFNVLSVAIKSYQFSQKQVYEFQQSRLAINTVIDDLRNATEVTSPEKGVSQSSINYKINTIDYTIQIGSGQDAGKLMKGTTAITPNVVKTVSFTRDATDGRILKVTVILHSPKNNSFGDVVIDTGVFMTNLSQ